MRNFAEKRSFLYGFVGLYHNLNDGRGYYLSDRKRIFWKKSDYYKKCGQFFCSAYCSCYNWYFLWGDPLMKRDTVIKIVGVTAYFLFLGFSFVSGFDSGKEIGYNFISFSRELLKILPFAFILIGLFEVWIKKESVEKHLGEGSGIKGYIWAVLLAGTVVGGLYVAFPVAYSLYNKGAKLSVIFTYIGASAIARVPMIIFEASFLGVKFTAIRLLVSLPLVIATSIALGNYLTKKNYRMMKADRL